MKEVPQISYKSQEFDRNGKPIGIYSDLATEDLILPLGVTPSKYQYLRDGILDGAPDFFTPKQREFFFGYWLTNDSIRDLAERKSVAKGTAEVHLDDAMKRLWKNSSEQTKRKYSRKQSDKLKDKHAQTRNQPGKKLTKEEKESRKAIFLQPQVRAAIRDSLREAMKDPSLRANVREIQLKLARKRWLEQGLSPQQIQERERISTRRLLLIIDKKLKGLYLARGGDIELIKKTKKTEVDNRRNRKRVWTPRASTLARRTAGLDRSSIPNPKPEKPIDLPVPAPTSDPEPIPQPETVIDKPKSMDMKIVLFEVLEKTLGA